MSMEMWSDVRKFVDGDSLNAKTLNIPVGQLGDRTDYLYARLRDLMSSDRLSSVVITGVAMSDKEGETPEAGNAVYLHQNEDEDMLVASKAKATMSLYDDFTAADSAFTVGILQSKKDTTGNVIVYGKLDLSDIGSSITKDSMIEEGETFRPGRYYLSANEAGKLTAHPNGPLIYVCSIGGAVSKSGAFNGAAVVNPQFLDIGTSHVHRTAVLKARPAGELSEDGLHVLGYATIEAGPFHLIFGGTWTGDGVVTYSFEVVPMLNSTPECRSGYQLKCTQWPSSGESSDDSDSSSEDPQTFVRNIDEIGSPVEISNGLTATLTVSDDSSSPSFDMCDLTQSQVEWAPMDFPEAGQGWVDHETSANDEYPEALYDYVLGMDPQIANYWPPVPPKSAAVIVNGVEMDNAALFPKHPTVAFGRATLHWFEDDEGRKPWPEDLAAAESNPAYDKVMVMHWVRGFQGATGPVTSLQPKKGSPLKIYGYGTTDSANVGDLEIDAAIDFDIVDGGAPGYMVPKRSENGKLIAGPVVERLVPGPGISLISKAGSPSGQGTVVIGLDNGSYRNQFEDIALENAEQAKIGMFPYVRLKGYSGSTISSPSAFTATMRVPTNLPDEKYALAVYASVFGEEGYEGSKRAACVKFSYNVLPDLTATGDMRYRNLKTSLMKPNGERTVLIPFGHNGERGNEYNGFDPILLTTKKSGFENKDDIVTDALGDAIPATVDFAGRWSSPALRPGYLVGIRVSRAVTSAQGFEPYRGAIGFVNLSWAIVPADNPELSTEEISGMLSGVVIKTNTIPGIRNAVESIGEAFGATIVR